jgi:CubicO group peptidase (beta-lactamase class C family)
MSCNEKVDTGFTPELDKLFSDYFAEGQPGGAVLVVKDGEIIYKQAFGVEDITTKKQITTKTLFNIGSITKPIVSYGILRLAKDGKLALEDDLYKYFPQFKDTAIAKKVKLFHLMTHTSGLPDLRKVQEDHDFYLIAKDEENWAPVFDVRETLFEPGTKYRYSNPAFNGLALIIEKITGAKWQDYIVANVFEKSGMSLSTITDGPHPSTGVAHAYVRNKDDDFEELDYGEEPTFAASGNGGVWSNVEELWKFEQAVQKYEILDKAWTDRSRSVFPLVENWQDSTPSKVGLSWFLTSENGRSIVGHTGSQGGFISDYCWLPEQKLFYVLLCNTPVPLQEIRQKLFSIVLKNDRH